MHSHARKLVQRLSCVSYTCQRTIYQDIPSWKIGVIGVPFCKGQANDEGVKRGPQALRNGGLLKELTNLGHGVKDFGDVNCVIPPGEHTDSALENMKDLIEVAAWNHEVSNKIKEILGGESRALVLGGDHSVVVGSVDGHLHARGDVGLLYVDAHADLNTADTSPSGNVHGMAVALLVKELHDYWPYLPGMDWQKPVLPAKNIAYIGLRSVDKFESENDHLDSSNEHLDSILSSLDEHLGALGDPSILIASSTQKPHQFLLDKFSIAAYGMAEVEKFGIHKVTEMALDNVDPMGTRSLHVSFDIDSLDTLEAPSTGVPVRGGLTLREGIHILELVYDTGRMNVMDLVEVNPSIGNQRDVVKTVEAGIYITKAAFGFSRLGNIPKDISDIPGRYNGFGPLQS